MKVKAIGDIIVVKIIQVESITAGGIVMPNNASPESFIRGQVISVGKDIEDIKLDDIIAFSSFSGQDMLTKDKEILKVLKYPEVYCVIEE